jgi:hypothetical protein
MDKLTLFVVDTTVSKVYQESLKRTESAWLATLAAAREEGRQESRSRIAELEAMLQFIAVRGCSGPYNGDALEDDSAGCGGQDPALQRGEWCSECLASEMVSPSKKVE